jgi:hypothetical protein
VEADYKHDKIQTLFVPCSVFCVQASSYMDGLRSIPLPGKGNVSITRAQGPTLPPPQQVPGGLDQESTLYLFQCRVEGCNWSTVSSNIQTARAHRNRSNHKHLPAHLYYETGGAVISQEEARRAAKRRHSRDYRARKKQATEVGRLSACITISDRQV